MNFEKLRILLIDDLEDSLTILKSQLTISLPKDSFFLEWVDNIIDAKEFISNHCFDLIFTDIRLKDDDQENNEGKDALKYAAKKSSISRLFSYSSYRNKNAFVVATNELIKEGIEFIHIHKDYGHPIKNDIKESLKDWTEFMIFKVMDSDEREAISIAIDNAITSESFQGTEIASVQGKKYPFSTFFAFIDDWNRESYKFIKKFITKFPVVKDELWKRRSAKFQLPIKFYYEEYYFNSKYFKKRLVLKKIILEKLKLLTCIHLLREKIENTASLTKGDKDHLVNYIKEFNDLGYLGKYMQTVEALDPKNEPKNSKVVYEEGDPIEPLLTLHAINLFEKKLVGRCLFVGGVLFLGMMRNDLYELIQEGKFTGKFSGSVGTFLTQCIFLYGTTDNKDDRLVNSHDVFFGLSFDEKDCLFEWWSQIHVFIKDEFRQDEYIMKNLTKIEDFVERTNMLTEFT